MRTPLGAALVCAAAVSTACAAPPATDAPASSRDPIIGGTLETQHGAVMALLRYAGANSGACSGTAIARSGSTGWLLTAAHCVEPRDASDPGPTPAELAVLQGSDYASGSAIAYAVTDFTLHPAYQFVAGSPYDFAVIRFTGAGSSTPTIPILRAAEDSLAIGTPLRLYGFGKTSDTDTDNSRRWALSKTVSDLYPLLVGWAQNGSGTCQGDSGGPGIVTVGGQERVASVTSYHVGVDSCLGYEAYGGRVSAVEQFIDGVLGGGDAGTTQTCEQCIQATTTGVGDCAGAVAACTSDSGCSALWACLDACAAGDDVCTQGCANTHAAALPLYSAIYDCLCEAPNCALACADATCRQSCGLAFAGTCGDCIEARCCVENAACDADATCPSCFTSAPPAACDANSATGDLGACIAMKCWSPCDFGQCGIGSSSAACQSCFEASCCAETTACTEDRACLDCATGDDTTCDDVPLYQQFSDCLAQHCATPSTCNWGGGGGTGGGGTGGGGTGGGGTGGGGTGGSGGTAGAGSGAAGAGGAAGGTGDGGPGGGGSGGGSVADAGGDGPGLWGSGGDGGCACRAAAPPGGARAAWLGCLAALGWALRRRWARAGRVQSR